MALLFCDSFDHYATAQIAMKYTLGNVSTASIVAAGGRRGTARMTSSGNTSYPTFPVSPSSSTVIIGAAVAVTAGTGNNPYVFEFMEGSNTTHGYLIINLAGDVNLTYVTTTVSAGTVASGTWNYIEVKYTVADAGGSPVGGYEVRVNGATRIKGGVYADSPTIIDTRNGGTSGVIDRIALGRGANKSAYYDDLYVCNSSGTTNNDFLGDVRVDCIFPTGVGNTEGSGTSLTGSDGNKTDNYLLVDETSPDVADYVQSNVVNDKDTYAFGDLVTTGTAMYGLQIVPYVAKSDSGFRSVVSVARLSTNEEDSAAKVLSTSGVYMPDIRETKPGGGAWDIADVNSAEFGLKVSA